MTPFGARLRALREEKGESLSGLAAAVGVSAAYLSALEHGRRGRPGFHLVQKIIGHLGIIWDDAEELVELARQSHPRVTVDTSGLDPRATELANLLARHIGSLKGEALDELLSILKKQAQKPAISRESAAKNKRPT
ncbi:MAG: helix-turn-helix transcriptional regulator [Parvibaculum sp.]